MHFERWGIKKNKAQIRKWILIIGSKKFLNQFTSMILKGKPRSSAISWRNSIAPSVKKENISVKTGIQLKSNYNINIENKIN